VRKIGILGGSFNPIHFGHLLAGRAAAEAFNLDTVLLMPCNVSPFKVESRNLASGADRFEMVCMSVAGDPLFEPCALELERGGTSYAFDTVRALLSRFPDDSFSFIIGMDSLAKLHQWYRIHELLTLCEFIIIQRPGEEYTPFETAAAFPEDVRERLMSNIVRGRLCDISSSEIRRRIAESRSIRYLVCPAVETFIRSRGLYLETKEA